MNNYTCSKCFGAGWLPAYECDDFETDQKYSCNGEWHHGYDAGIKEKIKNNNIYKLFHIAQLRHLYAQMIEGSVKYTAEAAKELLGPAIEFLEKEVENAQD